MAVLFTTAILENSQIHAAEVRSISREIPVNGATIPSWEVNVECAGVEETRRIHRVGKTGKWCSADFKEVCYRKKIKIADKVCGTHFGKRIDALSEISSANDEPFEKIQAVEEVQLELETDGMTQEILDLEQQQILIEEQRIQLKLKEFQLKKQTAANS